MKSFYVYYSYEEWGRGYIGARECECSPEEDKLYFGSFHDKTFNPSEKIILGYFDTREEALEAESNLHLFFQVDANPHFANLSRQTSKKFTYSSEGETWVTNGSEERKISPDESLPEGFRFGRILERRQWFTNGVQDLWLTDGEEPPSGFVRGRARMRAENNPQFNTKWINNGEVNAKIDVQATPPEGWGLGFILGRDKKVWINDGQKSKQHPAHHPLPEGWTKGRVMPWASSAGKKSKPNTK